MRLILLRPEVPSCDDCERYIYDPKTWKPLRRTPVGPILPREKGKDGRTSTPCHMCPKILQGDDPCPSNGRKSELSEKNVHAYMHYLECKAVGQFPDDAIVRRNAAIIRMIEDSVERDLKRFGAADVLSALGGAPKK